MGKKLAIKGHPTRGNEVIALLEMMGGNTFNSLMENAHPNRVYYIGNNNAITWMNIYSDDGCLETEDFFTLEEFLEKYPYKLNELVLCDDGLLGIITKMEWDCEKSDMKYYISFNRLDNKWYSSKNIKCKFMAAKNKKLAIKGHPTRGNEVIELLKMMGGSDSVVSGSIPQHYYYLDTPTHIDVFAFESDFFIRNKDNFVFYTLEGFLEKYPFKVGDKVIDKADRCPGVISEMKWDADVSDMKYFVAFGNGIEFVDFAWYANDSIEFCKDNKNLEETQSKRDLDKSEFVIKNMILQNKVDIYSISECKTNGQGTYAIKIADGYKFDSVDENGNIIVKSIKSTYPKTYDDCCNMLNADEFVEYELMVNFPKLINARNAYWKIAGEEMGLGKPWEPTMETVYCISRNNNVMKCSYRGGKSNVLEFPTEEMRDAFYENFKDLIEQCKNFL